MATPYRPNAEMKRLLQAWHALGGRSVAGLSVAQARSLPLLSSAVPNLATKLSRPPVLPTLASTATTRLPIGPKGGLLARIYQPKGKGPLPLVVYFHGGGWVLGGLADYDLSAQALAREARCVVISIGYSQAPEHRYPQAVHDAYAAFDYVRRHAEDFHGDGRRVAVAGEGAGANLAATVSLSALSQGQPLPIHQLLICPLVDALALSANTSVSHSNFPQSLADLRWQLKQYIRRPEDLKSPYLSVLGKRAIDLPPTTVITAELDPLAQQGIRYYHTLKQAAIDVELGYYPGVTADFFGAGQVVTKARQAQIFAGRRLTKSFNLLRPNGRWNYPHTQPYKASSPSPTAPASRPTLTTPDQPPQRVPVEPPHENR